MRNITRVLGVLVLALGLAMALPAFAEAETGSKGILEFSAQPENRSLDKKLVERKYIEYRHGRA